MTADLAPLGRAALAYAEQRWFVFPLKPRTKDQPLTPHGFKDASRNPEQVARWWHQWPAANVGLHPGPSGFIVSDADDAEGEATLARCGLTAEPTLSVITGRVGGGRHLYHIGPVEAVEAVTWGPSTTIRHYKGYVLAPPSVHPNGARYRWAGTLQDLKPIPPGALARLTKLATPAATPGPASAVLGDISAGERDNTLTSFAGTMRRRGMSEAAILAALQVENTTRCRPPLSDSDLERIAASVGRYAPAVRQPQRLAGSWEAFS